MKTHPVLSMNVEFPIFLAIFSISFSICNQEIVAVLSIFSLPILMYLNAFLRLILSLLSDNESTALYCYSQRPPADEKTLSDLSHSIISPFWLYFTRCNDVAHLLVTLLSSFYCGLSSFVFFSIISFFIID